MTTKATPTSSATTLASSIAYQPFGPLASLTYGNGLTLTKSYTRDYLLSSLLVQDNASGTTIVNRDRTVSM